MHYAVTSTQKISGSHRLTPFLTSDSPFTLARQASRHLFQFKTFPTTSFPAQGGLFTIIQLSSCLRVFYLPAAAIPHRYSVTPTTAGVAMQRRKGSAVSILLSVLAAFHNSYRSGRRRNCCDFFLQWSSSDSGLLYSFCKGSGNAEKFDLVSSNNTRCKCLLN